MVDSFFKKQFPNYGKRWTKVENKKLLKLVFQNKKISTIATILGRTWNSVYFQTILLLEAETGIKYKKMLLKIENQSAVYIEKSKSKSKSKLSTKPKSKSKSLKSSSSINWS